MSEQSISPVLAKTPTRPFPWICPKCRDKEVRRATIPHQCERLHDGQPITVMLTNLSVPRCHNCGELIFDYEAEEQINRAFEAQAGALGTGGGVALAKPVIDREAATGGSP